MARVSFAYARNQDGFRDRRPLGRYLMRNAAFLAAGAGRPLVEAEMDGLRVLVPTSDRTLARSVFASGDWDPLLVAMVLRALDEAGHRVAGTMFLEVGANFGVYSLPAVTRLGFAEAVAYEPDPASYSLLSENVARNGLGDRVTALNAALSARSGELRLRRSSTNAGDNRIVDGDGDGDVVRVRATTLDAEAVAGVIPVDRLGLAWLDVQGHEAQVLVGASGLLRSRVPVVLEYSSSMMSAAARSTLDRLIAEHYDALVDLGWCALTNRVRFQPATRIRHLVRRGRRLETDLLLLKLG